MKKIISITAFLLIANTVLAQKSIPQNIAFAFSSKYPKANLLKWEIKNGNFILNFNLDKKKYLAVYSPKADWLRTERKVSFSSKLPSAVKKGLRSSDYAAWTISGIKHVEEPGSQVFLIQVHNGNMLSADHSYLYKIDLLLSFNNLGELIVKRELSYEESI